MNVALPSSWTEAPIGTLCVNTEQVTPDAETEFIYVDIASVDRETKKITSPQRMLGKDAPSRARKLIKTGDTIVSTTRPNLNAVALVDQTLDGQIASTGFDVLRAPGLDPRWLGYLVRTSAFVDAMSSLVQGALYPAIRGKDVRSFVAPIAPANEQKRIADKLDTVLTRVDAVNTRLARVAPLLKRFRQSVLAAATSGRLTDDWRKSNQVSLVQATTDLRSIEEDRLRVVKRSKTAVERIKSEEFDIPSTWVWASLDALTAKIVDGTHHTPSYVEQGIPFISVKDIRYGTIDFSNTKFITEQEHAELSKRCFVERGDLLITKSGTIGRTAIVSTDASFSLFVSVALIKPASNHVNMKFIDLALQHWVGSIDVSSRIVGSTIKNLHLVDMKVLGIPFPSIAEQTEVVRRVETLFAFADRLEARMAQAQTAATRLTPALLAKAFRGELVPQDPNDEPAAELLRRLAQAPAAASPRRGRKAAGAAV